MTATLPVVSRSETFRAMSMTIEIIGVGVGPDEFDAGFRAAQHLAERWEQTFSRFRPESELSRLNAAGGEARTVSDELLWMVELAAIACRRTDGRFDPTILPHLVAAGYDRDIDLVRRAQVAASPLPALGPAPGMAAIEIDRERSTVRLPASMRLDLGGIAKGAYVDRLALALMTWPGGCVNAGGDLRVWGQPPSGEHWTIGIEDPFQEAEDVAVVRVLDGRAAAVATSATNRRRWSTDRGAAHHLIDPRTGRPTDGAIASCTAIAASTIDAEIATKSLMIARDPVPDLIDAAAAVIVDGKGRVSISRGAAVDALSIVTNPADRPSA